MKFTLTFKTPDVCDPVFEEINDEIEKLDAQLNHYPENLAKLEKLWDLKAKVLSTLTKYVHAGEYINIVFDTELGTATVKGV